MADRTASCVRPPFVAHLGRARLAGRCRHDRIAVRGVSKDVLRPENVNLECAHRSALAFRSGSASGAADASFGARDEDALPGQRFERLVGGSSGAAGRSSRPRMRSSRSASSPATGVPRASCVATSHRPPGPDPLTSRRREPGSEGSPCSSSRNRSSRMAIRWVSVVVRSCSFEITVE
jgi:hypothetical protein